MIIDSFGKEVQKEAKIVDLVKSGEGGPGGGGVDEVDGFEISGVGGGMETSIFVFGDDYAQDNDLSFVNQIWKKYDSFAGKMMFFGVSEAGFSALLSILLEICSKKSIFEFLCFW